MSKELTPLEALERIKDIYLWLSKYAYGEQDKLDEKENKMFGIIETALKRLECIENTTHSVLREDISKKLKALEIIKEIIPIEEEDFFYDKETDTYFFIGNKVSKEQFDLLKEVLL